MNKKDTKNLSKISRKSKKNKNQIVLKKKLKKILTSNTFGETSDDADNLMELDDYIDLDTNLNKHSIADNVDNAIKNKFLFANKHLNNIEEKGMSNDENEMLNVISGIISEPREKLFIPDEVTFSEKKSKNKKYSKSAEMCFDPNKSLAQKIMKRIKGKNCADTSIENMVSPVVIKTNFKSSIKRNILTNNDLLRSRKKLTQNASFQTSALEIFDIDKSKRQAVISSVNQSKENVKLKKKEKSLQRQISFEKNMTTPNNQDVPTNPVPLKPAACQFMVFSDFCVLILKPCTKLYICGKLKASLLYGSVEILGYKLNKFPQEIYSLPNYSLLCFESTSHFIPPLGLSQIIEEGIMMNIAQEILQQVSSHDSVLLLYPHNNIMTDFISRNLSMRYHNIFSKSKLDENCSNHEVFKLLQCQFATELHKGKISKNFNWDVISDLIYKDNRCIPAKSNKTVICGGKNAGKSTLLRYLINKAITDGPVLLIDLDPGQPEFSVSGLISATVVNDPLIGPNFTHLKQPDWSFCLGYINVAENEKQYVECMKNLLEYCKNQKIYKNIPWIINTMGFTGAQGLKLLTTIINIFEPIVLVELQNSIARNNFDFQLKPENINRYQRTCDFDWEINLIEHNYIHFVLAPFEKEWNINKTSASKYLDLKVERLLNAMAYFSQMPIGKSLSVLEIVPYVISMDDVNLVFTNIYVDYTYAPSVLNGRMVALCKDERFSVEMQKEKIFDIGLSYCYGYGIIRGIDIVSRKFYIITPVKSHYIRNVNSLVYAETNPSCKDMFLCSLPENTTVPYMTPKPSTTEHSRLMKTPKRNFNPFHLLKKKHNT